MSPLTLTLNEREVVARAVDRMVILHEKGRTITDGAPDNVLANDAVVGAHLGTPDKGAQS